MFFYLVTQAGFLHLPHEINQSINQITNCVNVIGLVLPAFCFLHTLLCLPPLSSPPLSNQSPIRTSGYRFKNLPTALTKRCKPIPGSPSRHGICSNIVVFGRQKSKFSSTNLPFNSDAPVSTPFAEGNATAGGSSGGVSNPVTNLRNIDF